MALNVKVYAREYLVGNTESPGGERRVRLQLNLMKIPFHSAGAETTSPYLAATSEAEVKAESVSGFSLEVDANNQPGLRRLGNVSWEIEDTPARDFLTNVLQVAVEQASQGVRIIARFDSDPGDGTWRRDFIGVVDPQQFSTTWDFANFTRSELEAPYKLTALDFWVSAFEQLSLLYLAQFAEPHALYFTCSDLIRSYFYQVGKAASGWPFPATFDYNPWAVSGGAIVDRNFAKLSKLVEAFANYYRQAFGGGGMAWNDHVSVDLTVDHFTLRGVIGGTHILPGPQGSTVVSCGYPDDCSQVVVLGRTLHIENGRGNSGTNDYREYNLDAAYTPSGVASGGNCPTLVDSLKSLAEQFLLFFNIRTKYDVYGAEWCEFRAISPVSPSLPGLLAGDPELVPVRRQHVAAPGFSPASKATAAIVKPPPIQAAYTTDTPNAPPALEGGGAADYPPYDETPFDVLNPTYTAPLAAGTSAISARLVAGSVWHDYVENQLFFLADPGGHPDLVVAADFDGPLNTTGTYPPGKPVTWCVKWGAGTLEGDAPQTVDVPTYQHGYARALFSLYCGGNFGDRLKGVEKLTVKIANPGPGLDCPDALLRVVKARGYDNQAHHYVVTGIKWNPWKARGADVDTVDLTLVRNI